MYSFKHLSIAILIISIVGGCNQLVNFNDEVKTEITTPSLIAGKLDDLDFEGIVNNFKVMRGKNIIMTASADVGTNRFMTQFYFYNGFDLYDIPDGKHSFSDGVHVVGRGCSIPIEGGNLFDVEAATVNFDITTHGHIMIVEYELLSKDGIKLTYGNLNLDKRSPK